VFTKQFLGSHQHLQLVPLEKKEGKQSKQLAAHASVCLYLQLLPLERVGARESKGQSESN
jgi:hypothetical protein